MKLVIANKAYSSWSLRPWILMHHYGIAFDETVVPLRRETTRDEILCFSPAAKCPVLIDGDVTVWESLAIIEYLAEIHPTLPIWPRELASRARARTLAAEMHAGFMGLRSNLPMNVRRTVAARELTPAALTDLARIETIFADASGGSEPFLFGPFGGVDAMFAPIVSRLHTYAAPVKAATRRYMDAVMALPAWQAWQAGAEAETWHIAAFDD
jgi:glutathione S-transferase